MTHAKGRCRILMCDVEALKMKIRLNPVVVDTQWSLTALKKYFEEISKHLQDITDINYSHILDELKKNPLIDEVDRQDLFHNHSVYYEREFPPRFRYSYLLLLYMVLETQMKAICNHLKSQKDLNVGLNDLRGKSDMERARKYLEKIANIRITDEKQWNEPCTLQKVRNRIVHANGEIKQFKRAGDKKYLEQYAKRGSGLSIDSWGFISIQPSYCQHAQRSVDELFQSIFTACGWKPDL